MVSTSPRRRAHQLVGGRGSCKTTEKKSEVPTTPLPPSARHLGMKPTGPLLVGPGPHRTTCLPCYGCTDNRYCVMGGPSLLATGGHVPTSYPSYERLPPTAGHAQFPRPAKPRTQGARQRRRPYRPTAAPGSRMTCFCGEERDSSGRPYQATEEFAAVRFKDFMSRTRCSARVDRGSEESFVDRGGGYHRRVCRVLGRGFRGGSRVVRRARVGRANARISAFSRACGVRWRSSEASIAWISSA